MVSPAISSAFVRNRMAVALTMLGVVAVSLGGRTTLFPPVLVWNASASAPIGLYLRRDEDKVSRSDLVLVEPPDAVARFADERRYLPFGVPLIKRIAALSGSTICGQGNTVTIDGKAVLKRRKQDGKGRPLPAWSGCHRLGFGEVFLAMEDVPDSFDGRYFGALPVTSIRGRLVPLWTP